MNSEERMLKLEEKVEKISDAVSSVDIKVEKLITKVDIILESHDKKLCEHAYDIKELKEEVKNTKFFKTIWGKILAFIIAVVLFTVSNLTLDYISSKAIQKQENQKIQIVQVQPNK